MFKVLSLEFLEHPFFGSLYVPFVQPDEKRNNNYISFIIGPNGTGKSKLLLCLINIMNSLEAAFNAPTKKYVFDYSYRLNFENSGELYDISYHGGILSINDTEHHFSIERLDLPRKILVSCFSFNDKYPLREQRGKVINERYHYLGLKSTNNNIFIGNPTKAAVGNLYQAIIANKDISPLRNAFEILELKPEISLVYKRGKYFRFLRLLKDLHREIDLTEFQELFRGLVEQKRSMSRNPELKRLGNDKINDFFSNEGSVRTIFNYVLRYLPELLYSQNGEISLRPVLNFESVSSFQEFIHHLVPLQLLSDLEIISFQRFEIKKQIDQFSFDDASSGEYHIILTFLNILSLLEDNSLVLLDEPEISLHPNWQIRYMDIFNKIFTKFPASHFMIASHSHFLVSALEDKHSTVMAITSESDSIKIKALEQNTFGWSAEQILLDVFNVATTRNYYLTRRVGNILKELSLTEPDLNKVRTDIWDLANLDLSNLNDNDPLKAVITKLLSKVNAE